MKKLKFAVIGCGGIGEEHIKILKRQKNIILSACSEPCKERRQYIEKTYNIRVYGSHSELIKNEELDACIIASPHNTHSDIGLDLIKKGIHILVEKPIDKDYDKAEKMITEAENKGVKLAVISQFRFTEGYKNLKNIIDNNELGRVFLIDIDMKWFRSEEYYGNTSWRGKIESEGGGTLITQCIHFLDQILWIFGGVDYVMGDMDTFVQDVEVEDTLTAIIRLKNGAICNVTCSSSIYPGFLERTEVHGTEGSVIIERDKIILKDLKKGEDKLVTPGKEIKIKDIHSYDSQENLDKARENEIMEFTDAIVKNTNPKVTGEEGLKVLKFALLIYEAIKSGKKMEFKNFKPC